MSLPISARLWSVLLAGLISFSLLASGMEAGATTPTPATSPTPDAAPASQLEIPIPEEIGHFRHILQIEFADNSLWQLLISFLILLLSFVARRILLQVVFRYLHRLQLPILKGRTQGLMDTIQGPVSAFVVVVGLFFAINVLTLPEGGHGILLKLFHAATLVVVFWGLIRLTDFGANILEARWQTADSNLSSFVPLLKKTVRVFVMILGVIMVIQNLGYQVTSIVAGLGIGGLAVALAAQDSLANFFGSLVVAGDRPFKVGDWIQIGDDVNGMVEEIGLRSTKVRTWTNSLLTIPNKKMADEIIENWTQMRKRRISFTLGVTYETSPETMELLIEDFRKLIKDDEGVHPETILVYFTDFQDSALGIFIYFFTISTKWGEHMEVQQRINLKLMKAVEARGSSIAYPTRTLHFANTPPPPTAGR